MKKLPWLREMDFSIRPLKKKKVVFLKFQSKQQEQQRGVDEANNDRQQEGTWVAAQASKAYFTSSD